MKRIALIAIGLCTAFGSATARAHDFWIEPGSYHPSPGERVQLTLRVGENFEGDPLPRMTFRIQSFVIRDANGERAVPGIENMSPAGIALVAKMPAVIGYRSNFDQVEMPRDKFESHLRKEGLDNRITVRSDGVQKERFARFAKTFLGPVDTKPLGWRLEIVPASAGQFRVVYESKPLAGTLVFALSREGKQLSARTDAKGLVSFDLGAGEWLVKTVHMIPADASTGVAWESMWASVTFTK